ncbi:MAG TPA: ribonuclease HII [Treponemataceae bacterium]|nr:ribonuclease HII [Treponemataceae bacterium]
MLVCGTDEAGRGPIAGPVTAAAVILPDNFSIDILNDSKKLSEKKRLAAALLIKEKALAWAVVSINHTVIDEINILQASLLAMKKACEKAMAKIEDDEPIYVIADGNKVPNVSCEAEAIVKADATVAAVMAASILAKTERDKIMCDYAEKYPAYGYEKHKGYPTKAHRETCKKIGPSPIQRKTFSYS